MRIPLSFWPNTVTALNLLTGAVGILFVVNGDGEKGCYALILASLFDLADGAVARALNATSEIGKQLDSLSDLVTFGLLPALLLYDSFQSPYPDFIWFMSGVPKYEYVQFAVVYIPLLTAIRLARFNSSEERPYFRGLPAPAFGLFIVGIYFGYTMNKSWNHSLEFIVVLVNSTWVVPWLMIVPLKLLSFKTLLPYSRNTILWMILLLSSLLLLLIEGLDSTPLILLLYLIISQFQVRKT